MMGKSKPLPETVPGLYVTVKDGVQRVEAAGAYWAGESHVPAAGLTALQLEALKAHPQLTVEERDIANPAAGSLAET